VKFYQVLERNRQDDFAELRQYAREDIDSYEPVLREILNLFGQGLEYLWNGQWVIT
jgi:hypothetical protein